MSAVQEFKRIFNKLDADSLYLIAELYAEDVFFADPFRNVEGLENLRSHFESLYDGVESIRFEFESEAVTDGEAFLSWTMHMRHRRFAQPIALPGCSHIRFADKVSYHRDYFDAGALIYENVPLLGGIVRRIKARL